MRDSVLLKVPGIKMVRIERLTNFISSEANVPVTDITPGAFNGGRDYKMQYVKLLDMEIDSPKGEYNPGYKLSLLILTEHGVRDNNGGTEAQTPRSVVEEVFDRLGIFPKTVTT